MEDEDYPKSFIKGYVFSEEEVSLRSLKILLSISNYTDVKSDIEENISVFLS